MYGIEHSVDRVTKETNNSLQLKVSSINVMYTSKNFRPLYKIIASTQESSMVYQKPN